MQSKLWANESFNITISLQVSESLQSLVLHTRQHNVIVDFLVSLPEFLEKLTAPFLLLQHVLFKMLQIQQVQFEKLQSFQFARVLHH